MPKNDRVRLLHMRRRTACRPRQRRPCGRIGSWNFKHIVNLGRIRLFHSVNIERGYSTIEIRSPTEVLEYD
jgi:hypothetical protein